MRVNKYQPHVLILPEDDANRQIANGFILNSNINEPAIQVLPIANGWEKVVANFNDNHVAEMRKLSERTIVLLIDFDEQEDRLNYVMSQIPEDLHDRVFVLGVLSEPEDLKRNTGTGKLEKIGEPLAKDCAEDTNELWGDPLLRHNKAELDRLILSVKPFLFN
jgi:hypothetical protein